MKSFLLLVVLYLGSKHTLLAQNNIEKKVSDFEISIEHSTKGTFTLLCNKGCAWKKLSFRDDNPDRVYKINEYGMDDATNNSQFILTIQCQKRKLF